MAELTMVAVARAVCETIWESGKDGAPAGTLYAGLMPIGFTLPAFEQMMDALVRGGAIRQFGNVYYDISPESARVYP